MLLPSSPAAAVPNALVVCALSCSQEISSIVKACSSEEGIKLLSDYMRDIEDPETRRVRPLSALWAPWARTTAALASCKLAGALANTLHCATSWPQCFRPCRKWTGKSPLQRPEAVCLLGESSSGHW